VASGRYCRCLLTGSSVSVVIGVVPAESVLTEKALGELFDSGS
jgi:hypothetical protein